MSEYRRLVDQVTVADVASRDYMLYGNKNKTCECPSCHHAKSFNISLSKNIGKCFRCGFYACSSVQYYQKTRDITWQESVDQLKNMF